MTPARRALAGLVIALAGAGIGLATGTSAAASDTAAQAWYRQVLNDLRPLQSTLPGALNVASGWAAGKESTAQARREFNRDLPQLERVRSKLGALAPLNGHRRALDDYVLGIALYAESLDVDIAATEMPPGALQIQLQNSYQRIRELGDNVFDQGTAELAPELGSTLAGPDVAAASHVPEWSRVGLSPAAPLVPSWPTPGATSSGSQSKAAWLAEVGMDGAPSQARVRAATAGRPQPSDLARTAVALGTAEDYVSSIPRPAGRPQDSNRLRLGLLVDAEALMSAEAGHLSTGAPARALGSSAARLVAIGGELRAES